MLLVIIITVLAVIADQLSKLAVVRFLGDNSVTVIPHVLDFTYVENRGAAFGMLADRRWVFLVLSTVAIVAILVYVWVKKPKSTLLRISLAFLCGGGIGNMIDRVALGYVVDFIDVTFVKFYVFNVADSFVTVGCALMIIWVIASEIGERHKNRNTSGGEDVQ